MNLSVAQLERILPFKKQIEKAEAAIAEILAEVTVSIFPNAGVPKRKKGKMSAAGRARIVAAQKARWAKVKAQKEAPAAKVVAPVKKVAAPKKKRTTPAAGKPRIIAKGAKAKGTKPTFIRVGNG